MRRRPIRRAQLIAPFGPGAMTVAPDGTSLIVAGLDHWYTRPSNSIPFDPEEFQFHEWRLEHELRVDHFGLPPDYRPSSWKPWREPEPNADMKIPVLRFPQWHVCPFCGWLKRFPLEQRDRPRCDQCAEKAKQGKWKPPAMVQVRFIAICEDGHIQDFPWREWVHKQARRACGRELRLYSTGGASLSATWVACECGASRSLERITEADPPVRADASVEAVEIKPTSYLSRELAASGEPYLCEGKHPWLGEDEGRECSRPLRGSLRGATNVYFALTRSAIYLPRGDDAVPTELTAMLEELPISGTLTLLAELEEKPTVALLRKRHGLLLEFFTDGQITAALDLLESGDVNPNQAVDGDDSETAFRRAEFAALRVERAEEQLQTRLLHIRSYNADVMRSFARVTLVEKLRETRALTGFSRVFAENEQSLEERKAMLWRHPPQGTASWLPAYKVFGEGIYLELDEERLREWERREDVADRVDRLARQLQIVRERRGLPHRELPARLVLIHTLAHLLMNQLIFDCGYSSASLRERLYVSMNQDCPMAGVLIYTAAGDAEGTMGGLVRMGKPGNLEPVVQRAIQNARWCSSDPVCMELGDSGGQGPESCNLAACHNCALVPETSCEQFNKLLDRWLVVGGSKDPRSGFFSTIP